jgi:hypothetical protein
MRTVKDHPVLLAVFLAAALAASSCREAGSEDGAFGERGDSVKEVEPVCGGGSVPVVEKWGKTGHARGCSKGPNREGRWVFWEAGYTNLEGFYEDGRKHGSWTVYNGDGTVFAVILFDNGRVTSKQYL